MPGTMPSAILGAMPKAKKKKQKPGKTVMQPMNATPSPQQMAMMAAQSGGGGNY